MLRSVATVGGWTMISRVFGFARDVMIASMAGTGPIADAFIIALRVPNLFRRLFGEGAFNAAFVPEFSAILAREGRPQARAFTEEAVAVLAFWLLLLTVAGEIFMPQVMGVLASGFIDEPEKFALTVTLARIMFPYLFLICLTALLSGVLNGLDRFAAAAAAPVVFNGVSIACMWLLTPYLPTVGHALSWGVTISGVLQLLLLMWAANRAGMPIRVPRPRLTPRVRLLMRRMAPGLVGAGVTQLNLSVDTLIVSWLPPSSASYLYFADRLQQLPLGVVGTAVGTAILPLLSRQVRTGEVAASIATLNRAIEYALVLTLPAAVALAAVGEPIMSVLFVRGAFTEGSAHLSSQALAAYALGLPAFVLLKVVVPAFFARGDTSTPVKVGFAAIALNLCLNVLLMTPLQHVGPAMATSLSAWFNVLTLLAMLLRRGHLVIEPRLRRRAPRMLLAALLMGAALLGLAAPLARLTPLLAEGSALRLVALRWGGLAALMAAGMAVFIVAAQITRAFDLRDLARLRRRPVV